MDKYEYNVKSDEIKKLYSHKNFEAAASIADEIDWYKVKDNAMINRVADIYENTKQYEKAKEILLIAYERSPLGRQLAYKLTILALRTKNFVEADEFYQDFVEMSPSDVSQYLLKYRIAKAKGEDIDVLIQILEAYVDVEMDERWQYELAKLYHEAGRDDKCVRMCNELEVWFNDGKYVNKAKELKRLITGVIEEYNKRYSEDGKGTGYTGENISTDFEEIHSQEKNIEISDSNVETGTEDNDHGNDIVTETGKADESGLEAAPSNEESNDEVKNEDHLNNSFIDGLIDLQEKEENSEEEDETEVDDDETEEEVTSEEEFSPIKSLAETIVGEDEHEEEILKAETALREAEAAAVEAQRAADLAKKFVEEARVRVNIIKGISTGKEVLGKGTGKYAGMTLDEVRKQLDEEERRYESGETLDSDSKIEIFEFDKSKEGKGKKIGDELTKTAEIDINEIKINLGENDDVYNTANIQQALARSMAKLMGGSKHEDTQSSDKSETEAAKTEDGNDDYLDDYSNVPTKRINRGEINRLLNESKTKYHTVPLSPFFDQEEDGQIGLAEPQKEEEQIEGQMTIDDVLENMQAGDVASDKDSSSNDINISSISGVSEAEDTVREASDAENSIKEASEAEDTVSEASDAKDSISGVSGEEDTISKTSDVEDSISGASDAKDSVSEANDAEDNVDETGNRENSINKTGDMEDGNGEVSETVDGTGGGDSIEDKDSVNEDNTTEAIDDENSTIENIVSKDSVIEDNVNKENIAEDITDERSIAEDIVSESNVIENAVSENSSIENTVSEKFESKLSNLHIGDSIASEDYDTQEYNNANQDSSSEAAGIIDAIAQMTDGEELITKGFFEEEHGSSTDNVSKGAPIEDIADEKEEVIEGAIADIDLAQEVQAMMEQLGSEKENDIGQADVSEQATTLELIEESEVTEEPEPIAESNIWENPASDIIPSKDISSMEQNQISEDIFEEIPEGYDPYMQAFGDYDENADSQDSKSAAEVETVENTITDSNIGTKFESELSNLRIDGSSASGMQGEKDDKELIQSSSENAAKENTVEENADGENITKEDANEENNTGEKEEEKKSEPESDEYIHEDHKIPENYRKLFDDFVSTEAMEESIADTLDNLINKFEMDGTSKTNNVIITGSAKSGKTTLGLSIIKAANRGRGRSGRKVAKVKATVLNKRGVALAMTQILGTDLIIEQAGNLMPNTIIDLMIAMKNYTEEMLIVLEDDKAAIDRMLISSPDLKAFFNNRLDIEEMEINDMVRIAKDYAASQFYEIDEIGELALYAKLDDISGKNPIMSIEDIQEVIDDAIEHAKRFSLGKIFGKMKKGKGDKEILSEQDFL